MPDPFFVDVIKRDFDVFFFLFGEEKIPLFFFRTPPPLFDKKLDRKTIIHLVLLRYFSDTNN